MLICFVHGFFSRFAHFVFHVRVDSSAAFVWVLSICAATMDLDERKTRQTSIYWLFVWPLVPNASKGLPWSINTPNYRPNTALDTLRPPKKRARGFASDVKGTPSLFLSPLSRELNTDTCPCQYIYSNALHPETNIKLLLSTDFVNHSLSLSLSLSLNNVIIHRSRFMQPLSLSLSLSFSISLSLSQQCYNT